MANAEPLPLRALFEHCFEIRARPLGFQLRDARTGAVLARGDSGLRMGADYSWKRGAVRLVSDRLIESR